MKNRVFFLTALIVAVFTTVSVTGCVTESALSTANSVQNLGTFSEVVIPVKDFESKGLVFTQVEFNTDSDGRIKGNIFTYQALLKEAQKVGADAIVNVVIDRRIEVTNTFDIMQVTETKKEIWYGSALAIRYTGAILQAQHISNTKERNFYDGDSTSSEQTGQTITGQAPAASVQVKKAPAGKGFKK